MPSLIGQSLGRYHILEQLGEGGMATVYKAFDTKLEREVALKLLRPEAIGDPAAKERFIREARAASALNHPNITTIYEIDEWHGQDFICMEYIQGEIVKKKIRFRTLGDITITGGQESDADTLEKIVEEVAAARQTERGNRADDKRSETSMEDRKKEGYF